MSLSMYRASVPVFTRGLKATSAIIDKAAAHCAEKKIDPDVMINFRLAPDMLPFRAQIFIMADQAKGCAARLAGADVPAYADEEKTFDELKARIAKTVDFISGFKPEQIDGSEEKNIHLSFTTTEGQKIEFDFTGADYLTGFVTPNFYFHMSTAYGILRHQGVEIGKRDFLGGA